MDPRIMVVLAQIDAESGPLPCVPDLAARVNLSPSRLRHIFREEVSVPLGCYVRRTRLRRAEELLRSTFLSVKEIAAATGFSDDAHFVRTFHRTYAAPPGRFRRVAAADKR